MSKTFVLGLVLALQGFIYAGSLEDGRYYTWQIPEPNIPIGSVITGVQVTLHDLTTAVQLEGRGQVEVFLADNPPLGWIGNYGDVTKRQPPVLHRRRLSDLSIEYWTEEVWSWQPFSLLGRIESNDANFVIDLADVVLADSWTYDIFDWPFQLSVPLEDGFQLMTMNAAILEFNDYMGNSTPVGLLLRSVGGRATLSRISVAMTIRAYTGKYSKFISVASVDVPADLVVIEAWAVKERAKLMAKFLKELKELEERITKALGGE